MGQINKKDILNFLSTGNIFMVNCVVMLPIEHQKIYSKYLLDVKIMLSGS